MKIKSLYVFILIFSLISCNGRNYKYKIYGKKVMLIEKHVDWQETNLTEELVDVIAYTDTIHGYNNDSIWYYNSNGSKMTILTPYKVTKIK
jgi:hypothetical protein